MAEPQALLLGCVQGEEAMKFPEPVVILGGLVAWYGLWVAVAVWL
jgi:hypothetical protein